jgi:Flp pilus assembly protein CpaB
MIAHLRTHSRNVALAAAAGILATVLTFAYAARGGTTQSKPAKSVATTSVLVADRNIAIGTPGSSLLLGSGLKAVAVPASALVPKAVTRRSEISHLVATQPIFAGEQLTTERFGVVGQQGIRSGLKGMLRLVQVPGTASQLLAGTLDAGDRVDVVASLANPESGSDHYTNTVLRDVLVVSPASGSGDSSIGSTPSLSVGLELTGLQAERLFWVEQNADWTLVLRPSVGAVETPSSPQSSGSVLKGGSSNAG